MTSGTIQVPPDSTGKVIDTNAVVVNAVTVQRQNISIADPAVAGGVSQVLGSAPTGSEQGLVTRNIPSGTQTVSGTVTANAGTGTMAVSVASLPLPTGAATAANQVPTAISYPTGTSPLTINTDSSWTFTSQVHHIVVQNNTSAIVNVNFDTTATAGSYAVPANSERALDLAVTVVHLYSGAASAVNGNVAGNIVLFGSV